MNSLKRKLTAILSADVVGYSKLMSDDEEATVHTLKSYRKVIESLINEHRGRLVDSPGDNILAEFSSVVDALRCAWDIQQEIKSRNLDLPENRRMAFRIGVNLGDVIEEEGRIYGDGVNVAARMEGLADAGGISISDTVYKHVKNKLPFKYEDQGEQSVKNIDDPIQVYRVLIKSETIHKENEKSIPVNEATIEYDQKDEQSILDSIIDMSVPTDKPSIAILPFVNMSGDPEQEYFSDGMTEEIITALSKVPDILVIASTSIFTYKGQRVKVQQVGKELGVKYVLEGSVRKAGDRIRLTAQLIDTATENHLWADRYDRDLKDIFVLQDELTINILTELDVRLWHDNIQVRANHGVTNNLDAYLKGWQGIEYLNRFNKNDNLIARQISEDVVKLDPNFAFGYALLGLTILADLWHGWSIKPDQSIENAISLSHKAISLDHTLAEPYAILCYVNIFKKQFDEAIAEARKAIEVQPNFFVGYHALGYALLCSGEHQKAEEMVKKAIRLSPRYWLPKIVLGFAYCNLEQYAESISLIKAAIKEMPDYLYGHVYIIVSYIFSGMDAEAQKHTKEILRIDPDFTVDNFALLLPYKNQSDTDRILNALRKAGLK